MIVPGSMTDSLRSLWGSTMAPFSCTSSCSRVPGVGWGGWRFDGRCFELECGMPSMLCRHSHAAL